LAVRDNEKGGKMSSHKWIKAIRLVLGFLLAPAVVPICLGWSLDFIVASIVSARGFDPSDLSVLLLAMGWSVIGIGGAYFGAWCIALPIVVLILLSDEVRLNFRVTMIMTLAFSAIYGVFVYVSFEKTYWFAGTLARLSVPGVIASGFCFYLIAVWSPSKTKPGESTDTEVIPPV
jgi:hypothetical protein